MKKVFNNFKAYELVDKTLYDLLGDIVFLLFHQDLVNFMNWLHPAISEKYEGKKVSIVVNDWKWGGQFSWRGIRTWLYYGSKDKYDKSGSQHKSATALDFDVYVDGLRIKPEIIRDFIIENRDKHAVRFIEDDVNWVHVDVRPTVDDILILWSPITKESEVYARTI